MCAQSELRIVRERTSEVLAQIILDRGQEQIGALIGKNHSTVGRRSSDLSLWPADDLLAIAAHHPELRDALHAWDAAAHHGHAQQAEHGCRTVVRSLLEVATRTTERLDTGRLTSRNARLIATDLSTLITTVGEHLDDLRARGQVPS